MISFGEERGGKKQITYFGAVYTAKGSLTLRWRELRWGGGKKLVICLEPAANPTPLG